jgi:hypothetical protein
VRVLLAVAISSAALASGCGSRTSLWLEEEEGGVAPEQCLFDEDCPVSDLCRPTRCIVGVCEVPSEPIACDDADPCSEDACDPSTGQCRFRPITSDQDGDGFKGPRAGYAPGAPEACGDDCDDASSAAFPGGVEACDGVDNDCNGVIDDGARYHGISEEPQRLSQPSDQQSGAAGLASDGQRWGVTLWGEVERREFRFLGISTAGDVEDEKLLTNHHGGSYGGPLVWTGSFYGIAWPDNRQDGNVEMYFNRLDRHGDKLGPDLRLTNTEEFSLNPSIYYDGNEFLVFWNDYQGGIATLWGQRISLEGERLGEVTRVSPEGVWAESTSLDFSSARIGASVESVDFVGDSTLNFVDTDRAFSGDRGFILIDTYPESHQTRFLGDRFVVVWSQMFPGPVPGQYVYGASFDEFGNPIRGKTALTPGGANARGVALLSLGDRALLFWSDDSVGNFEIFVKTIDKDLNELTPPERLTFADGHSYGAAVAFGPDSQVGVVFDDYRDGGAGQAYMLHLTCDNQ